MTTDQFELQSQYTLAKAQLEAADNAVAVACDTAMALKAEIAAKFSPIKVGDTVYHMNLRNPTQETTKFLVDTLLLLQLWENGEPVLYAMGYVLRKNGTPHVKQRLAIRYTPSQAHGYQIKD